MSDVHRKQLVGVRTFQGMDVDAVLSHSQKEDRREVEAEAMEERRHDECQRRCLMERLLCKKSIARRVNAAESLYEKASSNGRAEAVQVVI